MQMKFKSTLYDTYLTLKTQILHVENEVKGSSKWNRVWEDHPYTETLSFDEAQSLLNGFEYLVSLDKEISINNETLSKPTQTEFNHIIDFLYILKEYEESSLWLYDSNKSLFSKSKKLISGYDFYIKSLKNKDFTHQFPDTILPIKLKHV